MSRRFCVFTVADLNLAVDVTAIDEVLAAGPVTPVPLAAPGVTGLLNLRGEIATVVDARARLGLPPRPPATDGGETHGVHVVIRRDGEALALHVDAEGDVVLVDDDHWEPVPGTVPDPVRSHTRGAHPLGGRLLLELDPDRALAPTTT